MEPIGARFGAVVVDGAVDRARLAEALKNDPQGFADLEAIVHPLVAEVRQAFLTKAERDGVAVAVLDVPLLFETGLDARVDAVVVVSAPEAVQRERVLARPGMTPERFAEILQRQTPDVEKRRRADFVINTGDGLGAAREQVRSVMHAATEMTGSQSRD